MNSFNEIFDMMKEKLIVSDTARKLFIDPIIPIKMNNNKVILYIAEKMERQIVEQNYLASFKIAFEEILGFPVEIEFLSESDLSPEQVLKYSALAEPLSEFDDDNDIKNRYEETVKKANYKHTFDTFIVGDSNKLAFAACKAVADRHTNNYNPLFIYGDPGLGKTHLLSAVQADLNTKDPGCNVIYVSAECFVNEFVNSINYHTNDEFKRKYTSADVLLVDDVQFFAGKKESQAELFYIFNELHRNNKQIILTSDRPPKEINDIEQRLLSRFEWGLLADIGVPEFETRLAIIRRKAELLNMNIPANVMEYLADKLKNNIRQLEGAIIKMNALTMITDVPPTLMMAQNVIKDIQTEQQPIPVTVEKIINEVAHIYNVTPEEIRSSRRTAPISTARQVSIYVVHKITGLPHSSIGQEFGGRDHSTIVYAIDKVKKIYKQDASYRATIDDLIRNIGNLNMQN